MKMRLDHIAFRTIDRISTAQVFIDMFGYKKQSEFTLYFNEEKTETAECIALEPPEKLHKDLPFVIPFNDTSYYMAPEIFCSSSYVPKNVVYEWVKNRNGVGGIHHMAYLVDNIEEGVKFWKERGFEFTSENIMTCPGLKQIFTKPIDLLGGLIIELIEREDVGFCSENVVNLMNSTVTFS